MFRLVHLSDVHLGPLPEPRVIDLIGKRLFGYVNWVGKRRALHDMGVLSRIVDDIKAQSPDHIACAGDLVNIALPEEFVAATRFMETLGDPQRVSLVPGNHDAYVGSSPAEIEKNWSRWMTTDSGRFEGFPYIRMMGPIALVGLNSGVPTSPFMATGWMGEKQRDDFKRAMQFLKLQGLARVVMIHHPPYLGGATFGRTLTDAARFEKIVAETGAELILHGHNHVSSMAYIKGPEGRVPVIGAPSASAARGSATHRAGYHIFDFDRTETGIKISGQTRGLLENGEIGAIGAIAFKA